MATKIRDIKKQLGVIGARRIGNNTAEVRYADGSRSIRLHGTDILVFTDDYVTLNAGSWFTHTTKDRMNEHLPEGFSVYQRAYSWFVNTPTDKDIPFRNFMSFPL